MSAHADPFHCSGCHVGDFADFDHYCDMMGVPTEKTPQAFAAWLAESKDWKGEFGPVESGVSGEKEVGR